MNSGKNEFLKMLLKEKPSKEEKIKFTIKNNLKGNYTLNISKFNNFSKIIVRDFDYLINKVNNELKEDYFKIDILNVDVVKNLVLDIIKQSIKLIKYNNFNNNILFNISKNEYVEKGFIYLTEEDIIIPILIILTKKDNKIKLEVKFKEVLEEDIYICKANNPCKKRIEMDLIPFNICCGNCEFQNECYLSCNDRNKSICFDKSKL